MDIVNFLAQLWGFSLIIICFSFLLKPQHFRNIFAAKESELGMLILGMIYVVLGVASLLAYRAWTNTWMVLITLLSWGILFKGVLYLFAPEVALRWMQKFKKDIPTRGPIVLVVGIVLGCILVYLGSSY